ncbi:maleylpyruvate isomerase N-terminal domain-containing protein [Nonomuraea sediminis]|uniref:maleylpyruvate isomerase N-terminal domain-containing protein n=1 Tax=Nonomuraea sediminis TaxID=2835864 RepID=UPI001BDC4C9C|nr:maleylpyruvate isomerase N-terminal domain-containing protein [Nonomuraea sediminis]
MTGDPAAALAGGVALLERALAYTLGSLNLVTPENLTFPTPCARWDLAALLDHMDDSLAALSECATPGPVSLTPGDPLPVTPDLIEPGVPHSATPGVPLPVTPDLVEPGVPHSATPGVPPQVPRDFVEPGAPVPTDSVEPGIPVPAPTDSMEPGIPGSAARGEGDSAIVRVVPAVVGSLRARACGLLGAWAAAKQAHAVSIGDRSLDAVIVAGIGAIEVAVHGWDVASACGRPRPIPPRMAEELLDLVPLFVTAADRPHRFAFPTTLPPRPTPSDHLLTYLGRNPH